MTHPQKQQLRSTRAARSQRRKSRRSRRSRRQHFSPCLCPILENEALASLAPCSFMSEMSDNKENHTPTEIKCDELKATLTHSTVPEEERITASKMLMRLVDDIETGGLGPEPVADGLRFSLRLAAPKILALLDVAKVAMLLYDVVKKNNQPYFKELMDSLSKPKKKDPDHLLMTMSQLNVGRDDASTSPMSALASPSLGSHAGDGGAFFGADHGHQRILQDQDADNVVEGGADPPNTEVAGDDESRGSAISGSLGSALGSLPDLS